MKKMLLFLLLILLINIVLSSALFAQSEEKKRIVVEELVLQDPTVSKDKKWLVGGAGEFWSVSMDWESSDDNESGGPTIDKTTLNGTMSGGNIYLGYDNWTLTASYRRGTFDFDGIETLYNTATLNQVTDKGTQVQEEIEVTLRYLMRGFSTRYFVPYALIGYNHTTLNTNPIYTVYINKSTTPPTRYEKNYNENITYASPLLGLGGIIPFNAYVGLRADLRMYYTFSEIERSGHPDYNMTESGSGIGGAATATGYLNIYQGLNLQLGAKYQYLNTDTAGGWDKLGFFGMLGYTYKF